MYWRKQINLLALIVFLLITLVSGCSSNNGTEIKKPKLEGQEPAGDESSENANPADVFSEQKIMDISQEDVDGPGGLTPFGPEQDPLFDFYSIPADWPRVVPLMTEFIVTDYRWMEEEMYAAGYGNVSMSRANNFYTNAQKKHVSSNIWEQDPAAPSITEGPRQVFNYTGEGHTMSVVLIESSDNSLYFELYFWPSP